MIKLIVGLGNPGEEYANNFHNLGFKCLDKLSKNFVYDKKSNADICFLDEETILCKPQTFMNLSGESVSKLQKKYKIQNDNILIVHDDISVKIGKFRYEPETLKTSHNGIRSICQHLSSTDFCRIRVGACKTKEYDNLAPIDWVLMDIPEKFKENYEKVFSEIENYIKEWINGRSDLY